MSATNSPRFSLCVGRIAVASAIVVAGLVAAAAPLRVRGQESSGSTPDGRVFYAPQLRRGTGIGADCACRQGPDGRATECTCEPRDPVRERLLTYDGLVAQNLGRGPTRFAVVYQASTVSGCEGCGVLATACSPEVEPGLTWTFAPMAAAEGSAAIPGAAAAVVYSLSPDRASDAGAEWAEWLAASGLAEDTTLADLACRFLETGAYSEAAQPSDSPCEGYGALHRELLDPDGRLPGTTLPAAPLLGAPAAVSVASVGRADLGAPVIDRSQALALGAALVDRDGAKAWVAPGGYGNAPEGFHSVLALQNAGSSCANVSVQPHRYRFGAFGEPTAVSVPLGARIEIDVARTWPELLQGAALRIESDDAVAATLTNVGPSMSAASNALPEGVGPVRWLLPRAYQEQRSADVSASARRGTWRAAGSAVGATRSAAGSARYAARSAAASDETPSEALAAEGWETSLSVFNPSNATVEATFRFQAEGQPPRPLIGYPVEARSQVTLQPGFGLGLPGGPGWVEMTSGDIPMTAAAFSLRSARDLAALGIEYTGYEAWTRQDAAPGVRSIGVADLAGPALGTVGAARVVSSTLTMTDTLQTVLAVQNPLTSTSRIAIDAYAEGCGYVGTIERAIDPRQTLAIPAFELPSAPFGGDSAVIRVLEGDAAVVVETTRSAWLAATPPEVPPDLSTAYLAGASPDALPPPDTIPAGLAVAPATITLERPSAAAVFEVTVEDVGLSGRCLSVTASSDSDWLYADRPAYRVPGTIHLTVDPAHLGPLDRHRALLTVTSEQADVAGSPAVVEVVVTGSASARRAYLPFVAKRVQQHEAASAPR